MALKVNKMLTTKDGQTIPSGSVIVFGTEFPPRTLEMNCRLFLWLNTDTHTDLNVPAITGVVNQFNSYVLTKQLTQEDYVSLTPLAVHQWVKSVIESWPGIGSGNTEIIL